jgi:hypothetical protein
MMRDDPMGGWVRLVRSSVNQGAREAVYGVEQVVLGLVGDRVCLREGGSRVEEDLGLGVQ